MGSFIFSLHFKDDTWVRGLCFPKDYRVGPTVRAPLGFSHSFQSAKRRCDSFTPFSRRGHRDPQSAAPSRWDADGAVAVSTACVWHGAWDASSRRRVGFQPSHFSVSSPEQPVTAACVSAIARCFASSPA